MEIWEKNNGKARNARLAAIVIPHDIGACENFHADEFRNIQKRAKDKTLIHE